MALSAAVALLTLAVSVRAAHPQTAPLWRETVSTKVEN
jgi:hypothetical protein